MKTIEQIIEERLHWSYPLDRGLAASAARDIIDDITQYFNIEVKPYLEESPTRLFDVLADMTRKDISIQRKIA